MEGMHPASPGSTGAQAVRGAEQENSCRVIGALHSCARTRERDSEEAKLIAERREKREEEGSVAGRSARRL